MPKLRELIDAVGLLAGKPRKAVLPVQLAPERIPEHDCITSFSGISGHTDRPLEKSGPSLDV